MIRNNIESAYEVLKTLMGVDDPNQKIEIADGTPVYTEYPSFGESVNKAFLQRPDYIAVLNRKKIAEENLKFVKGRRLPYVYLSGEYIDRSGDEFEFKENWNVALRLSMPIFHGGDITAEINRARIEIEKADEKERSLRIDIVREIKDSYINLENAQKRIDVSKKAIEEAEENQRIEVLRYETGTGTSTDVIDAKTALLRAHIEYYQALYDRDIAIASLKKAIDEETYTQEVSR
ncbi:MAG: TolC family protein [Nitrospirota bacterium]